jgi:cytochrome c-type biogenesis protein CcmE
LDLTPRTNAESVPTQKSRRRWGAILVLVIVLGAGGVIVTRFLSSAIDYYCNVDEIDQRSGCEAGRRLRVQGVVDAQSVESDGVLTKFSISFNEVTLPVQYEGEPGGIFDECIPVVVHGELKEGIFYGDRVEVKHSNEYEAENRDRIDKAEEQCSQLKA